MNRARRSVVGVLLATAPLLACLGGWPTAAHAQSQAASAHSSVPFATADNQSGGESRYRALVSPVAFGDVRFALPSNHRLYVSDGDVVHAINDRGQVEQTFTGLPTADGLAVSADGSTLYVAESSGTSIVALDVSTGTTVATFDVASCPKHLAVLGSWLFYSAGCAAGGQIGHIDLTSGLVSQAADQTLANSDALLTATSDTLITADDRLRSWSITADTSGAPLYGAESDGSYFPHVLSLTTHGDDVVVIDSDINGYGLYRPDLGAHGFISTVSYPTAAAWSADGTHIAAGSDTPRGNGIRIISTADSTVGVQAVIPSLKGLDGYQAVFPGAIMYSADESTIVALAYECRGSICTYSIARAGTATPLPSTVTVKVVAPTAYGRTTHVEVQSPGRPNVQVLVTATGGSWHTSRLITTNADARGHVDLVVPYSSVITASLAGDLQHEDAAPKNTSVRVPSAFTASLARGVRVSNGVVHYAKLADMRQRVLLAPGRASRMVRVTLLYRIGARWFTTKPFTTYTSASGYVSTAMKQARRSVLYRIRYSFAGDTWNGGASTTTRAFILG